jgi:hypothetical protein
VKVKENWDSNHGKRFKGRFQQLLMKAHQLSADQVSRRRKCVSATEQLSQLQTSWPRPRVAMRMKVRIEHSNKQ